MGTSLKRMHLGGAALVLGLAAGSAALADDRQDVPQAIFDKIAARIAAQTTFERIGPAGLARWWSRSITLIEFVKAASPTYPDTYLHPMRYSAAATSDHQSLAVADTHCAVSLVYRDTLWSDPTVVCEPVILDAADHPS